MREAVAEEFADADSRRTSSHQCAWTLCRL